MDSIPFRLKFTLITAVTAGLLSGAEPPRLSACSEAFPPSFLAHHQGEAAFSPDLNLRFLLGKLARHYFPDCIMLKSPDSGPQQTDPRPGPEENGTEFRLFQSGWEALRRDPENRFPERNDPQESHSPRRKRYNGKAVFSSPRMEKGKTICKMQRSFTEQFSFLRIFQHWRSVIGSFGKVTVKK